MQGISVPIPCSAYLRVVHVHGLGNSTAKPSASVGELTEVETQSVVHVWDPCSLRRVGYIIVDTSRRRYRKRK